MSTTVMDPPFVLEVFDTLDLHCLIRALEEREAEMDTMGDAREALRCRELLRRARAQLNRLSGGG